MSEPGRQRRSQARRAGPRLPGPPAPAANGRASGRTGPPGPDTDVTLQAEWLRQVAASIDEAFWLSSERGSVVHYVSPAYQTLTGRSADSLLADPSSWLLALHPEDRARVRDHAGDTLDLECRLAGAAVPPRWVWLRWHPVRDPARAGSRVTIATDITSRKRAEDDLERFFATALDLICIAGTDGYFRRLNAAWERTLGHRLEELYAAPWIEFVHPDDRQATMDELDKLKQGIDTVRFENRYRCRDGTYRWLLWACPAPPPGATTLYAAARDITELKNTALELEQSRRVAEAASRAKSQFLANMSHELRTPLNGILGYAYLLEQEARERGHPTMANDLQHIRRAGEHLLRLINDVLDLSKVESGRVDLDLNSFEVAGAVHEAVALVHPMVESGGNTIEAQVDPGTGCMYADPTRLRQILFNLLSNAAKFTHGGHIRIRAWREIRPGGDVIHVDVSDTGIGMSPDQVKAVFDEFTQGDASTTRRYGGTGLGLTITLRFCRLMGGDVTARSTPGVGTTMSVTLPAKVTGPAAPR